MPSPPLPLLDVPCTDLQSLFLCLRARVYQEDRSSFTRKSTAPPRSCLPSTTFDFHSEVTSHLKNVLANALVTFTRKSASLLKNVLAQALSTFTGKSTHSQDRACKCTFDFHSQVTSPLSSSHSGKLATVVRFSLCDAVILFLRA